MRKCLRLEESALVVAKHVQAASSVEMGRRVRNRVRRLVVLVEVPLTARLVYLANWARTDKASVLKCLGVEENVQALVKHVERASSAEVGRLVRIRKPRSVVCVEATQTARLAYLVSPARTE